MTSEELHPRLGALRERLAQLSDAVDALRRQHDDDARRLQELEHELEQERQQCRRQQQELTYLRAALTLTPDRRDVKQTRAILVGILRDLDQCLSTLTALQPHTP